MDIGDNLREIRQRKKITQADLSKLAGIKQPTISAIENGINKPALETLILLSHALNCTVSDLIGETRDYEMDLEPSAQNLLNIFDKLNDAGKSMLIAQAEIILQQPAMRKKSSTSSEAI